MNSLSDQLLKAGLVTKEQVEKSAKKKPKPQHSKQGNPSKGRRGTAQKKKTPMKKEPSDLAKFYQERSKSEKEERDNAIRAKKEASRIKKETNKKINTLICGNLLNDDAADIRYNFVIGTTIKYLFVTEKQQQELVDGKLAITFLNGKRSLIPLNIGQEILKLNANKIVIIPV